MIKTTTLKVPLITSFLRYNVSACTASICDFLMLIFFTEIIGIYYVIATFIGAVTGASVAFILGRNWTFFSKEGRVSSQGFRFFLVVSGSILINTIGVYFFTDVLLVPHYTISKVMVAVLVGIFYNFPMQRYFVFR